jgi:hypothetical protein
MLLLRKTSGHEERRALKGSILRERQTVNQAGRSAHDMRCHQYLAM